MKTLFATLLALLFCIMISCEMILEIDLPQKASKLVVNSIITTDCVMTANVFRSADILDTTGIQFQPVANATVSIVDESGNEVIFKSTMSNNNSNNLIYRSKNYAEPGKSYTLSVSAPGFETIEAKTRMPDLIKNIQVTVDSTKTKVFDVFFNIKFPDDPAQRNYYEAYYIEEIKRTNSYVNSNGEKVLYYDSSWYRTRIYYEYTDPQDYKSLFSDVYCTKGCVLNGRAQTNSFLGELLEAKIEILNINPEYHEYLTTTHLQGQSYDDPTAQPVQPFNNIKNGYGIFSGFSRTYFKLK